MESKNQPFEYFVTAVRAEPGNFRLRICNDETDDGEDLRC